MRRQWRRTACRSYGKAVRCCAKTVVRGEDGDAAPRSHDTALLPLPRRDEMRRSWRCNQGAQLTRQKAPRHSLTRCRPRRTVSKMPNHCPAASEFNLSEDASLVYSVEYRYGLSACQTYSSCGKDKNDALHRMNTRRWLLIKNKRGDGAAEADVRRLLASQVARDPPGWRCTGSVGGAAGEK